MTLDPKDAALRERVRKAIQAHGVADTLTDAVLAAIAEPAPTPEPPRVTFTGFTGAQHTVEYVAPYFVADGQVRFLTAVNAAFALAEGLESDSIVTRLLALKGQGEPCAPSWWIVRHKDWSFGSAYMHERHALEAMSKSADLRLTTAYSAPPAATPRAPQKVIGACAVVEGRVKLINSSDWNSQEDAFHDARRYAAHWDGTAHAVLLGDELQGAPLVRGDVTEGGR